MFDRLGSVMDTTTMKVLPNLFSPTMSARNGSLNVVDQWLLNSRSQVSNGGSFHIDRRDSAEGYIPASVKQPLNSKRKIWDDRRGHNKFYSIKEQICQTFPLGLVNT